MSSQTVVFGTETRRSEMWRVYRISTANSTYELEVENPTSGRSRRCAVLTCVAPESRAGERYEDSSPQAGEVGLHSLSPMEWIGRCLTVGTARTSVVQSVEFIGANEARSAPPRRARTGAHTQVQSGTANAPAREERRDWAPFPLGYVEMAEAAASVLKNVCHRHDLQAALRHEPLLRRRLELALTECRLMLDVLAKGG